MGEPPALDRLERALRASWDDRTAHLGGRADNRAAGQCYPTSRVVQWFYPEAEIVTGQVDTGVSLEDHFWNLLAEDRIDLSWSQFPEGSTIVTARVLDRTQLADSPPTVARCALLLERVQASLARDLADQA